MKPIYKNPITIIRMKDKDGSFLFSEEECLRLLDVYVDRAKQQENAAKRIELMSWYKATGRGRLFWKNSE